jgi:hypothetical protein
MGREKLPDAARRKKRTIYTTDAELIYLREALHRFRLAGGRPEGWTGMEALSGATVAAAQGPFLPVPPSDGSVGPLPVRSSPKAGASLSRRTWPSGVIGAKGPGDSEPEGWNEGADGWE